MSSLSSSVGGLYVSAPGKIILFGEHAVVYGRTAVAGSIDLRTYLRLNTSADGRIYLCLPDLNVERTWDILPLQRELAKLAANPLICNSTDPPPLELIVPIARKLSGSNEDQSGVQHLAVIAFWYLLISIILKKRIYECHSQSQDYNDSRELQSRTTDDALTTNQLIQNESFPSSRQSSPISNCSLFNIKNKDLLAVKITVRFKLPSCIGLGSSGAYCVCIAAALLQTAGLIPTPTAINTAENGSLSWEDCHLETIRRFASMAESLIHGRASGLDAAICTYGGVAQYVPGKHVENLPNNIPELRVILINSRVERNTSRMVQTVKEKLKKYPSIIEAIFDAIDNIAIEATKILQRKLQIAEKQISGSVTNIDEDGSIAGAYFESENFSTNGSYEFNNVQYNSNTLAEPTRNGRSASVSSNSNCRKRDSNASNNSIDFQKSELHETFDKLNDLCRINNQLLISLGVGHAKVEQICTLLARFGIHPKMTGAGGGGCLFAFMKPDISQTVINMIRDELQKDGYEIWHPSLGGPGVILHSRRPSIFVENIEPRKERVHVVSEGMSSRKSKNDNSSLSLSSAKISLKSKLLNNASSSHQSTPSLKHKK